MIYSFVDKRIPKQAQDALLSLGFTPILIEPPEALIGTAVQSHTDLAVFCHGNTAIVSKKYLSKNPALRDALYRSFSRVIESECEVGKSYPYDAVYNALVLGGTLFAKTDTVCPDILSYAEEAGLSVVHIRQGYPACLTLKVGEAAITSDAGLYRAITESKKRALLIGNSDKIKLAPYPYGFIGGASGCFGKTVYFIGNLLAHERGEEIEAFIESLGYSVLSLMPTSDSLFDLGSIVFSPSAEPITPPIAGSKTSPATPKSE